MHIELFQVKIDSEKKNLQQKTGEMFALKFSPYKTNITIKN